MITKCRICNESALVTVANLGNQKLSDFRSDKATPPAYPLELLICRNCSFAQLSETAPRDLMYHDGYGYKSGVNEKLRENLENLVTYSLNLKSDCLSWLDIASNDGTLLSYVPDNIYRVGIDPVSKFKEEAQSHADLIIDDYFPPLEPIKSKFDIISASFMFYDVDDPNEFVRNLKDVLNEDGILVIQQNYLLSMLEFNTFDNISHEHIGYYSLTSINHLLKQHGLEVFDAYLNPTNGGSIVTSVCFIGKRKIDQSVSQIIENENKLGLRSPEIYEDFAASIHRISRELYELVNKLKKMGKSIQIYGASTRGATIWQSANLGPDSIDAAVERQEAKIGKYFSAIGVPIISEAEMRKSKPDYLLIGPWFLRDAFIERENEFLSQGGSMIFPLPSVEIHSK